MLALVAENEDVARQPPGPTDDPARELSLAEPVIVGLMRRMGGSYTMHGCENPRFRLLLVSAEESHVVPADHS